jgi:hypothetical protein
MQAPFLMAIGVIDPQTSDRSHLNGAILEVDALIERDFFKAQWVR